jgi:glycosyltransferase involved in cell wall biosynthesis
VIPAYNEAATIAGLAARVRTQLDSVIVVDDASTDGTAEQLTDSGVTLLQHAQNQGKAAALWSGMQRAVADGASGVITLDGDGQHAPEDIPRLLDAAAANPDCIIIAARARGGENAPKLRRFANRFADFWIAWASGTPLFDSQSGFRYYPAQLLAQLDIDCGTRRDFVFESEALIEASWLGYGIVAVPIDTVYQHGARASHYRAARDTSCIVKMVAGRLLSRWLFLPGLWRSLSRPARWHESP